MAAILLSFGFLFSHHQIQAQSCNNATSGGLIEANEFGCPNPTWDPSLITNVALPTGGSGTLEYVWIFTTGNPSQPASQWTPIPNSNSPQYNPPSISVTTYYRRCARRSGCTEYVAESNYVVKEAICCDNVTNGGQIASNQVFCNPPFDPAALTSVTLPTGGTLALEYQWVMSTTGTPYSPVNTDWVPIAGANAASYDPPAIAQTTYYIRLSRRHGCLDYDGVSNTVTVVVNPDIAISMLGENETCLSGNDGTVSISNISGGTPGFTYLWNDPSGSTSDQLSGLPTGTYIVTVTDMLGCTASASQTLIDGPPLQVQTATFPVTCPGDTDGKASVLSVGGLAPFTYQWNDSQLQTTETANDLGPGTYQVLVSDDYGCIGTGTAVVADAVPLSLSTFSTAASCTDESDGTASVQVNGGVTPYTYQWDDMAGQTTATAFNLPYGPYTVTVTDANGCTSSANAMVTAPMQAQVVLTTTDVTCFGLGNGSAEANILGGDPAFFNFLWNDPAMSTTNLVTGLSPGTFNLTVTDSLGCTVDTSVTITEPPLLVLTSDSDSSSCANATDGSASVFPAGGTPFANGSYQYVWNAVGNPTTPVLQNVSPGTYIVTVTDANGCSETTSVQIGAPAPLLLAFGITHVSCAFANDGGITTFVNGGSAPYTYQWNAPGNPTTPSLSNLPPGSYALTVTDANNCTRTGTATVTEPLPLSLGFNNTDVICQDDTNGQSQSAVTGGTQPYTYLWGGGQTTAAINGLAVGSYSLTVTDANGCTVAASTLIDFTSTFSSSATATPSPCFDAPGGSATATGVAGTPPYTYLWSNGVTTATASNLLFGSYTVTVTDADGCTSTSSAAVNAPPLLECDAQILTEVETFGGTQGSAQASASGGVSPYTYKWNNGSTSNTVTGLGAGTHTVTVTDANGCECIRQIVLVNPSKIGNFIWNDDSQNGIQDVNEVGVEGITVNLTGETSQGVPVSLTTVSDSLGQYAFDGLKPGFYEVGVELPANHSFTYYNVGNDNLDSDIDPATGLTQTFVISQGIYDSRWDAGLIILDEFIDIGDFVWYDINHNGIQDQNEAGVHNVLVRLRNATTNNIIATRTTNQLGWYLFENTLPGNYIIEFSLASFPSGGYILSPKDQGSDDSKDSDANPATGRTDAFTILPFTLDNLSIDAGIYKECDNATDGGLIGHNESLCGLGADPAEIVNVQFPTGGYGVLEYLWLSSTVPVYNGPGDPNWSVIPNSNSQNYNPGPISVSTYYIRCARRQGCNDYIAESNVVAKEITAFPLTQIIDKPNVMCMNEGGRFEAAIAGAGATYSWNFGPNATPGTATTRVVNPVSWTTQGTKTVSLTVTRFGCSFTVTTTVFIDDCDIDPLIVVDDVTAELQGDQVQLKWKAQGEFEDAIFTVQCSEDGTHFQNLWVMSGTAAEQDGQFKYLDLKPRLGENTYRIRFEKMTSIGLQGYSATASIYFQPATGGLVMAYPNPTSGKVTVEMLKPSDEASTLRIFSSLGKVVESIELMPNQEKAEIDLGPFQLGMYLIEVKQVGRRPQVCRVFKAER